jgi:BirA family transcriptional regulator, biotin operon repressor / biotin---[acetyl-CoA-carboxylase] ligase
MAVSLPNRVDPRALLTLLADGGIRSGAGLARELGTKRGEVARLVERLREAGIAIGAIAGRGYRLPGPVELLDAERIRGGLRAQTRPGIHRLDVLFEVDSTNTRLLELAPPPPKRANVCSSELQYAGRGRRGRPWTSPFGGSLALSLGWSFADAATVNPTLSLAVGVAIARALGRVGAERIRLKWPNDIWLADRKIGGVLVELRTETGGPAHAVIGIGLNVSLSADIRRTIEAGGVRIATVSDACPREVSRNALAVALLEELLSMLGEFEQSGFAAFREEWLKLDALAGRDARVLAGDRSVEGTARGVDTDGALLLEVGGRVQRHVSGEVSLRLNEEDA